MPNLLKLTTQGVLYPKRFIEGRLKKSDKTISSLQDGEGAVLVLDGKKVAVYKSTGGKIEKLSPVCKHLGCIVGFNQTEKTWDCPCHGSRYKADGTVFKGPAKKNLDKL
jgi:Rieske Fe-S protein